MSRYDDIINLNRPISKTRKPMSIEMRAAQFAPFSALTGYNETIKETSRFTDKKRELSDGLKEIINRKLCYIKDNNISDIVTISYFEVDKKKSGGEYITISDYVKKVDNVNGRVVLNGGKCINFDDIISVDIANGDFYDWHYDRLSYIII